MLKFISVKGKSLSSSSDSLAVALFGACSDQAQFIGEEYLYFSTF